MIEMMIMLGGKGGELFPLTKATYQSNIIADYPQYGTAANIAVSPDGLVLAMYNGSVIKIYRYVSGAWSSEASSATTYPVGGGDYPAFSFSEDSTKLFALTSGEVLAYERSGTVWTKSTVLIGGFQAVKSVFNGVAIFTEDYTSGSTLKIYTKPVATWSLQQTINIAQASGGAQVSFNVSSNGQYIATHDSTPSTTKTYPTYKWNGSTFASNGTVSISTTGSAGAYSKFIISDDGSTFVAARNTLSGAQEGMVAKYSGGSWSQVSSTGLTIPRSEAYVVNISSDGKFIVTLGSSSTYVYRLSSAGIFISKHQLVPSAYSSYLISPPVITPDGSTIYTPLTVYGTGPIGLLTNKR